MGFVTLSTNNDITVNSQEKGLSISYAFGVRCCEKYLSTILQCNSLKKNYNIIPHMYTH